MSPLVPRQPQFDPADAWVEIACLLGGLIVTAIILALTG